MSTCSLTVSTDPELERVLVNQYDITSEIRGPEVTAAVSAVAADPRVRAYAVERQRELIAQAPRGIVIEGRDITTVVAPDADVRLFLTADLAAREARRAAEFADPETAEQMRRSIASRDAIDATREHSPLTLVDGVTQIDATHMSLNEVIDAVRTLVTAAIGGNRDV